jgi:hypothetical protein
VVTSDAEEHVFKGGKVPRGEKLAGGKIVEAQNFWLNFLHDFTTTF